MLERLESLARSVGFSPPKGWDEKVALHFELLQKWGGVLNLTSHGREEYLEKDIKDCLHSAALITGSAAGGEIGSALDIGSGSGLPGLLLAVFMPNTHFTLAEPRRKRASFLRTARVQMGIENAAVLEQRIEPEDRFEFDLCLSRASIGAKATIELAPNLLAPKGFVLLMLGERDAEALQREGEFGSLSLIARRDYEALGSMRSLFLLRRG